MKTKHAPGQLEVRFNNGDILICPIGKDSIISEIIGTDFGPDYKSESKANAAEIVKRWNLHDELTQALLAYIQELDAQDNYFKEPNTESRKLKALLKKANSKCVKGES